MITTHIDPAIGVRAHGVFTFAAGNVVHHQDIFVLNALLHGAWTGGPGRTVRYEMWGGLPADPATGSPATTARVAGTVTVDRRSMTGPYVVTILDAATRAEVFRYDGSLVAARIVP